MPKAHELVAFSRGSLSLLGSLSVSSGIGFGFRKGVNVRSPLVHDLWSAYLYPPKGVNFGPLWGFWPWGRLLFPEVHSSFLINLKGVFCRPKGVFCQVASW